MAEVAVFQDGGHQIGEEFRGAGEGGHAEVDEFLGHGAVEARGAFVVEGQQGDDLTPSAVNSPMRLTRFSLLPPS